MQIRKQIHILVKYIESMRNWTFAITRAISPRIPFLSVFRTIEKLKVHRLMRKKIMYFNNLIKSTPILKKVKILDWIFDLRFIFWFFMHWKIPISLLIHAGVFNSDIILSLFCLYFALIFLYYFYFPIFCDSALLSTSFFKFKTTIIMSYAAFVLNFNINTASGGIS